MFSKDPENITTDEQKVSRLLIDLPRVTAPSDFAVKVRSRIARGSSAGRPMLGLPLAVRYAVGLGSVLAAFAMVAFVWNFTSGQVDVPPVLIAETAKPIEPANSGSVRPPRVASAEQRNTVAEVRPSESNITATIITDPKKSPSDARTLGSSSVETVNKAREISPKGLSQNGKPIARPKDLEERRAIPIAELLSFFGVDTAVTDKGLRVDMVRTNSSAERLGVRKGDIIISINDQPLKPDPSFKDPVTVKGLRVVRDGQTINIALDGK